MSVLFAGTSPADFEVSGGTVNTSAAALGPYVNEGVMLTVINGQAKAALPSPQTEFWGTFYYFGTAYSSTAPVFQLRTGISPLFWLYTTNVGNSLVAQYWNGSAWISIAPTTYTVQTSVRYKISFYLKMHDTAGIYRVYIDDALIWEFIGDTITTAATSIDNVTLHYSYLSGSNFYTYSALIIANEDTRDMVFDQNQFASNGTNTAWANDYTSVTHTGVNDATLISSDTANQVETYNQADIDAALAQLDVKAVVVSARCRKGDTGPSNLQAVARIGSTDYTSANLNPGTGFAVKQAIFETNPATSQQWTVSDVNAAEFGVKSIA